MSYRPLSIITDAIGDEAAAVKTFRGIAELIIADKEVLAATLRDKGVEADASESLIDLINKVVPLQVNFNVALSEDFSTGPDFSGIITDSETDTFF